MSPKMRDISSSAFAPPRKMSFVTRVVLASTLMAVATCETPLYAGNGSTPLPSGASTLPQSADSALKVPSAPEEAGEALSKSSSPSEEKKPTEVEQDICRLGPMPPDSNKQCLAILPRWTYNATEGKCVPYLYGGCGGTANLFVAEADCQAACPRKQAGGQKQDDSAATPEVERKLRSDDCSLKLDGGTCYGFFRKWGFNQETGRCEWFVYGGCGGNANRFDRAESCQEACGGSEPLMDTECDKSKCEWGLWGHYEVKKCVPVYERGECCPTRFECPTKAVVEPGSEPSCTYKGKTYPVGARMPEVTEAEPCQASCFCQKLSENVTKVTCASVECPDLFGVPGTRGCKRIYEKPNQCCASTYNCNKTLEAEDYLCEREGRQYLRGEKIFTSREEGLTCLCNDAFVEGGLNSSACLKVQCAWESVYHDRLQRDCTPVYFNEGGCPIDWVCPGDKGEKVDTLPIRPKKLEPTPLDGTPAAAQSSSEEKASSSSETEADSARESRARASDESGERPAAAVLLPSASQPSATSNVCLLIPKADDKCETKSQKWFYNAIAGACEAYSEGCAKSDNRFDTKEACESACAGSPDGCYLETERGRCKARVPAWHFDKESGECKSFFYGGCGGNQNNFRKLELCESSCKNRAKPAAIGTAGATLSDDAQSPGAPQVSGDNQGNPLRCTLGSETFRLGTGFLPESNSCYQCRCSTPPSLTCQEMSRLCPASPGPEYTARYEPGKCCPTHELEPQIVGAGLAPPQVAAAVGDDEAAPGAEMTYP